MTKNTMAVFSILIFLSLVALAIWGWRKRVAKQTAEFDAPLEALDMFGELLAQAKGFYVATTYRSNSLERIAAYGLGARGVAQFFVFSEGLLIVRNGERPLAIDKSNLLSVGASTATIDRAVEKGGLLSIDWLQGATELSTHLRIVDSAQRAAFEQQLLKIISREVTK